MFDINPMLATDWYKPSHIAMYHPDMEFMQSNLTARSDRLYPHFSDSDHRIVVAGFQAFIKWFLIDHFNTYFFSRDKEEVINEISSMCELSVGHIDMAPFERLYDLGFLPLEIRVLPEGSLAPVQVPIMTIKNTVAGFGWLVNYLESVISSEIWKPITSATTAWQYKKLCKFYSDATCDDDSHLPFQVHEFAFRGQAGIMDAALSGVGHLISSSGTDTIPAIWAANKYYNMSGKCVAHSIPATEHSVATTRISKIVNELEKEFPNLQIDEYRLKAEIEFIREYITEIVPTGPCSYVADSYDYWAVITKILPLLYSAIVSRDGKLVIRPDSGDPVDVVCGTLDWATVENYSSLITLEEAADCAMETAVERVIEETPHGEAGDSSVYQYFVYDDKLYLLEGKLEWNRYDKQYYFLDGNKIVSVEEATLTIEQKGSVELLWEIFGGTVNSKGLKVLDSHIGMIYGDSITVDRANRIMARLMAKGFASSNITFGVGSYTTQYVTRDSLGFAVKATGAVIDGEQIMVSKEPKTDPKKRSAKGFVKVVADEEGKYHLVDNLTLEESQSEDNALRIVFQNGRLLVDESLTTIRDRLNSNL